MPGLQINSLDKIVRNYFAGVTSQAFTYDGEEFRPKKIVVSPLIFRGTTCPMTCGGCCFRFSLVWLPRDLTPDAGHIQEQWVMVNGIAKPVFVDPQIDHSDHFCRHLNKTNGLCGIYRTRPFTCDFELIRFIHRDNEVHIATRLFGRGWSYTRVTGQTGAMCDVLPASERTRDDAVRKLRRLKEWTDYWRLVTYLPEIIRWVESGPHDEPMVINPGTRSLVDLGAI